MGASLWGKPLFYMFRKTYMQKKIDLTEHTFCYWGLRLTLCYFVTLMQRYWKRLLSVCVCWKNDMRKRKIINKKPPRTDPFLGTRKPFPLSLLGWYPCKLKNIWRILFFRNPLELIKIILKGVKRQQSFLLKIIMNLD